MSQLPHSLGLDSLGMGQVRVNMSGLVDSLGYEFGGRWPGDRQNLRRINAFTRRTDPVVPMRGLIWWAGYSDFWPKAKLMDSANSSRFRSFQLQKSHAAHDGSQPDEFVHRNRSACLRFSRVSGDLGRFGEIIPN